MSSSTIQQFLLDLKAEDIRIWLDGERLRVGTPRGAFPARLREELSTRRSEIVAFLKRAGQAGQPDAPALVPVGRDRALPLSFEQDGMWFLHQLDPDNIAYNLQTRLLVQCAPEVAERAWNALLERHEVLRTTYASEKNGPSQRVHPPTPVTLPVIDLRKLSPGDAHERLVLGMRQALQQPFNLATGPVWRLEVFQLPDGLLCLLAVVHHIATDGWSLAALNHELRELCEAYAHGREPVLAPLPIQYADYAAWQRTWLSGEALERSLGYWRERLAGMPPALALPTDFPHPPVQTSSGGALFIDLPAAVGSGLRALGQRCRATFFMTLLAVFKVLLARYAGETDVVVGTPIAGRGRPELEHVHGLFLNSLVLRTDVSGDPSFADLLGRVRETVLGAFAHQELPFEKLVQALQPKRDLSRNPLFQVMFHKPIAQSLTGATESLGLEKGSDPWSGSGMDADVQFDLTLDVHERGQEVGLLFSYNTDLFRPATIERMAGHYARLAEAVVADPQRRIAELDLLSAEERQQAISGWNEALAYPRGLCLHERFEQQVERTAHAVAVVCEGERLTYAELNRRANRLAHRLRELGIGPEQLVGLRADRSLDLAVGIIGILKSGGAYLPFDPAYPKERIAFMLEDSRVSVVVTQTSLAADFEGSAVTAVLLDEPLSAADTNPLPLAKADNLAYVIYTSGSTGKPKGALISHYNVTRLFEATDEWYRFDQHDVWTLFHSYAFDFSVWEMWGALLYGGRLVVVPYRVSRAPDAFRELLLTERVTVLNQTPSAFRQLLQAELAKPKADLALRYVIFGGEALELQSLQPWLERYGDERPLLVNMYGITETTVHVSYRPIRHADLQSRQGSVIGCPIPDLQLYILDPNRQPAPLGVAGEIYVGGAGVARGYLNRPELTAERFVADPFAAAANGARLYRTGDLARRLENGDIEYLGRIDNQVKVRGFRIELGEIEAVLARVGGVREAVVLVREERPGDQRLVAYVVCEGETRPGAEQLREAAGKALPAYMVPPAYVFLEALPLTPNGKIDRKALPAPEAGAPAKEYVAPHGEVERKIAALWQEVLNVRSVGVDDNFFDLGGHSVLLAHLHSRLREAFPVAVTIVELFEYPTVRTLARRLAPETERAESLAEARARAGRERGGARRTRRAHGPKHSGGRGSEAAADQIAVIGMDGRFPGAENVERFWANLCEGVESITFFSDADLGAAGVDPAVLAHPGYVKAKGIVKDVDLFDAAFFGYSPADAEVMDPQQRLLLQCAWRALESAGYHAENYRGLIGVYASSSFNSYSLQGGPLPVMLGQAFLNDKDYLATRVSYKLGLRGPSATIQTACSSSLVAIAEACDSLLEYRCDMALAGGVSVWAPVVSGYFYQEGSILSSDGHCRAFDARASGTVPGSGMGVVVLKRLSDALDDGDAILAVVRGAAVNNDGSLKVGFTAPSVAGQAEVITMAQALSGVEAETIGYVEAHGTGTILGDPIEMAALTQAFRASTRKKGFCAIGAVKTNIGHLDAAAGIAGFIKTVLCVQRGQLPPSLNYERPNPKIDFAGSPFYVNTALAPWRSAPGLARRAGVSSFGLGGTNVHVIVEQAPQPEPEPVEAGAQVLVLSARSAGALDAMTRRLAAHLRAHPQANLGDVSYTLQLGRKVFGHRRIVVGRDAVEVAQVLEALEPGRVHSGSGTLAEGDEVVFMFSGQGTQYPQMTRDLYREHAVFRAEVERCCEVLRAAGWDDPRALLYPEAAQQEAAAARLMRTEHAQVALFVVEYALARLWMSWGVEPAAMIGHSVGEYVAACLSGVMELEDGLRLVALRGRLMQAQPGGAMLGVGLSREALEPLLSDELSVAAVNAPGLCVVSGLEEAVGAFERRLCGLGHEGRRLHTSHAFHSAMMEPVLEEFTAAVGKLKLQAPRIPYVSNCTGEWMSATQARDPAYWARHLRQTVEFSRGVQTLLAEKHRCFVELGPGNALCTFVRQHAGAECTVAPSVRHPREQVRDDEFALAALGRLWLGGRRMDWARLHAGARRRRVPLPTYAFEEQRYWIDGRRRAPDTEALFVKRANVADWFYVPSWKRGASLREVPGAAERWLLLGDAAGLADRLAAHLREQGESVCMARAGTAFARTGPAAYTIAPGAAEQYEALFSALRQEGGVPERIVHLWGVTGAGADAGEPAALERYFWSAVCIAKALGRVVPDMACELTFVSDGLQEVTGTEALQPSKALLCGPCRVIPQEYPHVRCRSVDVEPALAAGGQLAGLLAELRAGREAWVAHRGAHRWLRTLEPAPLEAGTARLRERGTYLITGALGGIGMALAQYLARTVAARLVLVGRSRLPEAAAWDAWLASHAAEDRVSEHIRRIRALEALGAEVMVAAADVTQVEQMREVVAQARQRFGIIHGAIHCAGLPAGGVIELKTLESAVGILAPKVRGTRVLAEVLQDMEPDFLVLCSSLTGLLGGAGQVDYTAANAYLDAFALAERAAGRGAVVSIAWDAWNEVGMAVESMGQAVPAALAPWRKRELEAGLRSAEGVEVLQRVLASGLSHVVVSTRELLRRIEPAPEAQTAALPVAPEAVEVHARAELSTAYVAARNDTERAIAALWQELLRVERVGIHDNFIELGGHSLMAIQATARLRERLGVNLTLDRFMALGTIEKIAAHADALRWSAEAGRQAATQTAGERDEFDV